MNIGNGDMKMMGSDRETTRKSSLSKILNERAVFSDGTKEYRIPAEPMPKDIVTVKLRTAKENVDRVILNVGKRRIPMMVRRQDEWFDYFEADFMVFTDKVCYYFELECEEKDYYYTSIGLSQAMMPSEYFFWIKPGFQTPDWAKGAIFYQIFVDRFYNGDTSNDVLDQEYVYIGDHTKQVKDWNKYPETMGVREFYGGDLKGVLKKLDYLEELGVEVIYFNPLFVSPSNHKYDIQDYDYIDPHYGVLVNDQGRCLEQGEVDNKKASRYIERVTSLENLEASNRFFIRFVEEVHKRGMKVILDGVFNHCGSFNKWMDRECIYEKSKAYQKGAYVEKDSAYHTFFKFYEDQWPYNPTYDGWWGHDTLPKLNYEESEKLFAYVMKIAEKWVSPPFCADGWRLDVAADLGHSREYNHYFWKEFRKVVKKANPDALILAEHYGNPCDWLQGEEWDSVMNYDAFMEPVSWFLTGMEKHSDDFKPELLSNASAFFGSMIYNMSKMNMQSLQVAMNELSNHDHSRFMTRTNRKVGRVATKGSESAGEGLRPAAMRAALVIQMTWTGAPTIYYGDEVGVCGWTDPDNRRTYPWTKGDKELLRLHKELIILHKSYEALKVGSLKPLFESYGIIAYGRFDRKDQFVVAVNNNDYPSTVSIPVWEIGITSRQTMIRLLGTNGFGFDFEAERYWPEEGHILLKLPPASSVVLKNAKEGLW